MRQEEKLFDQNSKVSAWSVSSDRVNMYVLSWVICREGIRSSVMCQ